MSDSDAELRRLIAAEHGLDEKATSFLTGSTFTELERSAVAFARLIGQHREEEPPRDFFTAAEAAKAARKRALADALIGRPSRPTPAEPGRPSGFDGGARRPIPTRRPPEQEHNELVLKLASVSRTYGVLG